MTYKEYEQAIRTLHAAAVGLISPNAARATVGLNPILKEVVQTFSPLICKCCGGQIDRTTLKCRSCGTEYHKGE